MPIQSDREVLEDAIFRDFEDYTTHAAYADLLADEGDPRGEYIRLQLALENTSIPVKERRKLDIEATRLYREHFHDWVGHLDFRVSREPAATVRSDNFEVGLRRGWITSLQIHRLTSREMVERLVASSGLRMLQSLKVFAVETSVRLQGSGLRDAVWKSGLRKLTINGWYVDPPDAEFTDRDFLGGLPALETLNLGSVEMGVGPEIVGLPSPRLRSLTAWFFGWPRMVYLLSHSALGSLRTLEWSNHTLQVSSGWLGNPFIAEESEPSLFDDDDPSPELAPMPREIERCPWTLPQLVELFESPRYRDIRDLRLSLVGIGDILPEAIVRSGLIRKLEELRLTDCGITDRGALMLMDAKKHPSIRLIDLRNNPLTPAVTDRFGHPETAVWKYTSHDDEEIPF